MKDRKEASSNAYHIETLNPQDLQRAQEENSAEFVRHSKTLIYTVEKTTEYPDSFEITYARSIHQGFPIGAKGMVKPGDRILGLNIEKLSPGAS